MKKKVALLLALVMILSMLPMNVFGAPRGHIFDVLPRPHRHNEYAADGVTPINRGPSIFRVLLAANDLAGLITTPGALDLNAFYLDFQLSGGNSALDHNERVVFTSTNLPAGMVGPLNFRPNDDLWTGNAPGGADRTAGMVISPADFVGALNGAAGANRFPVGNTRIIVPLLDLFGLYEAGGMTYDGTPASVPWAGFQFTPTTLDGSFWADLNIYARHQDAALTVTLMERRGFGMEPVRVMAQGPLTQAPPAAGVEISTAGEVPISTHALLNPIRITERAVGVLAGTGTDLLPHLSHPVTIRLTAPSGVRWDNRTIDPLAIGGGVQVFGTDAVFNETSGVPVNGMAVIATTAQLVSAGAATGTVHLVYDPIRREDHLYITLPPLTRATGMGAVLAGVGTLEIRGLWLISTPGAPEEGEIYIDVQVGRSTGTPNLGVAADTLPLGSPSAFEFLRTPNRTGSNWENLALLVARRGVGQINVTGPATVTSIQSGRVSFLGGLADIPAAGTATTWLRDGGAARVRANDHPRWLNRNYHTIRIEETVTGTMLRGVEIYEFRMVQPGAHFVNAEFRVGALTAGDPAFGVATGTGAPEAMRTGGTGGWQSFDFPRDTLPGGTLLAADRLTLMPRPFGGEMNARRRIFDLRFQVSVEAGFEARHGNEIQVEVWRNQVYEGTVTIAYVSDILEMNGADVHEIYRNQLDVIARTPVPMVQIHELEAGTLGSWNPESDANEIWIWLQPTQNGVPIPDPWPGAPLQLDIIRPVTVNTAQSEMVIRQLDPIPSTHGAPVINRFEIVRPSRNAPATITIDGGYVFGGVVPGIDYNIVVGGPAVSRNSRISFTRALQVSPAALGLSRIPVDHNYNAARVDILFDTMPYYTTILRVVGTPHVDVPDLPGQGRFEPIRLYHGMPDAIFSDAEGIHHIPAPFRNIDGASMLNPRFLAYLIGADIDFINNQVVMIGTHRGTRQRTTVLLPVGSNFATVNGTQVDIATFVFQESGEWGSGPANTVRTLLQNDRSWVPVRFLAYAFGFNVSWENHVTTIYSIYQ
jgi:hypothetical protein